MILKNDFWTYQKTFKGKNEAEILRKAQKYAEKHNVDIVDIEGIK